MAAPVPAVDTDRIMAWGWQSAPGLCSPGPGEIDVWLLRGEDYAGSSQQLLKDLSQRERQRALRKKIPAKRFEYILGQAMLRRALGAALACAPAEIAYVQGHKGKPALDPRHGCPDLHFNISHSAGMVLIALSAAGEVGIDVEAVNGHTSMDLVGRRAFSAQEYQALLQEPQARRRQRFFQLWTCKEAVVKCSGDGIHSGMNLFTVCFSSGGGAHIGAATGVQAKTRGFSLTPLDLGERHKGTLVCARPPGDIHYHYLPADTDTG